MNIDGKTILITGASQGIGQRLAIHFAKRAAEVIITARNQSKLNETADLIKAAGGRATSFTVDLCNSETIERLINDIQTSGKRIDVLINNAADGTSKPLLNTTFDEIESIIRTNVIGCLQLCRLIAPLMVKQGGGMIINVSSLAGYNPNGSQTAYCTSKAAVNALSEALRDELSSKGIHVMNIAQEGLGLNKPQQQSPTPFDRFAQRLDLAIAGNEPELFLSPSKKWLMRLYKFSPEIANLKKRWKR